MEQDADFRIDRDGVWHYRGSAVRREGLARLFASMLCRRGDEYLLQTPEQMLRVSVDDAPFVITAMEALEDDGGRPCIRMSTGLGDALVLGAEHPLYLREAPGAGELRAYVLVRDGMPALVHRNVFYRLAEIAQFDSATGKTGVHSGGVFFPLE